MQVKITHRHGPLSPEVQALLTEKAERLLHTFERITYIEVTVDLHAAHDKKSVEFRVDTEHKKDFVAIELDKEMLTAADAAFEKVKHQLHKYKEKLQDHRRDPHHNELP